MVLALADADRQPRHLHDGQSRPASRIGWSAFKISRALSKRRRQIETIVALCRVAQFFSLAVADDPTDYEKQALVVGTALHSHLRHESAHGRRARPIRDSRFPAGFDPVLLDPDRASGHHVSFSFAANNARPTRRQDFGTDCFVRVVVPTA